jgi:hypothetical protein
MSRTLALEPVADRSTTYLLVHLDDAEIDESLLPEGEQTSSEVWNRLRTQVTAAIWRVSAACGRRIAIVDAIVAENDPLPEIGGRILSGWQSLILESHEITRAAREVSPGTPVIVAGFARHDCVHRLALALERRGCPVQVHELGTLPLSVRAAAGAWRLSAP